VTASSAPQSVLGSVRDLLPTIAASAAEVDRRGSVDPRVIRLLHDAGYFSLLRPPGFGGLDTGPDVYLTATRELAAA
jgi:3-hydroxy-9,10-secoandrosta-1,3,5(10)-triene-9,17-dione monooxygenase